MQTPADRRTSRRRRTGRARAAVAAAIGMSVMAACHRPVASGPPLDVPANFSASGEEATPQRWWRAFGDAELDALVEEALRGNFSLRAAWARLDQARAAAAASGAARLPGLEASAGSRRRLDHDRIEAVPALPRSAGDAEGWFTHAATPTVTTVDSYATTHSLGAAVSYELDLWGRLRSLHAAARLDLGASAKDLQAAAITLSADLSRTWFALLERRGRQRLLKAQLATNRTYLEVLEERFRHGQTGITDVLQQRQLIESLRGERRLLDARVALLGHQLAVLCGRPPTDPPAAGDRVALPAPPPPPRAGPPAALLRRRPDLRAAELRVLAADRRVHAAIADLYPRIRLGADASTSAARFRDLFDNWAASIAADLAAPLLDGGARRAEVARRRALLRERLDGYGQAVLVALREVEDALAEETEQRAYLASLERQLRLADQVRRRARDGYARGAVDFLRVLSATQSHQGLQGRCLQARLDLLLIRIGLYRALAGAWSLPRPATDRR